MTQQNSTTDERHFGTIWIRDRSGTVRLLVEPNPEEAEWNPGTQEVVRWNTAHGEELVGVRQTFHGVTIFPWSLIRIPAGATATSISRVSTITCSCGKASRFSFPTTVHGFSESAFGEDYIWASKDRDPLDALTDDVMSGVNEFIRRGVADPDRLFLHSTTTGASSIGQLLTQTRAFRAAVAHGEVYDWLGHYQMSDCVHSPCGFCRHLSRISLINTFDRSAAYLTRRRQGQNPIACPQERSGCRIAESRRLALTPGSSARANQQCGCTGPPRSQEAAWPAKGYSSFGSEGRCRRSSGFHLRAVWHRCLTPNPVKHPARPFADSVQSSQ